MSSRKRTAYVVAGPIIFLLTALLLAQPLTARGAQAIGLLLWMVFWWAKRPVNMAITALLPLVVNAVCGIVPIGTISSMYASDCVVLLFGAGLLTIPWARVGLDRRVALKALSIIGPSMKSQVLVWYFVSVILSTILPNVVVCALFCQLAVMMLHAAGYEDMKTCPAATPILLAIAWGVGIGGVGTPLGGAQNIISVTLFEQYTGKEFMYVDWVAAIWPYFIIGTIVLLVLIMLLPTGVKRLEGTKEYFRESYKAFGPMSKDEKICAALFLCALGAAFARPLFAELLPSLTPAYCFLVLGFLGFFITAGKEKKLLLDWQDIHKNTMWDLLAMVGGGIALGLTVSESGITGKVLDVLRFMELDGGFATIVFFAVAARILAEFAESTTAAAVMTPIAFEFASEMGINPIPLFFVIIMAYCEEFFLPLGVRAVPVGYGLDANKMLKYGVPFSIITTCFVIVVSYGLMLYWPPFSALSNLVY